MKWLKRAILRRLAAERRLLERRAVGGEVGPRRKDDSIGMWIHAGEYRVSAETARRLGTKNLDRLNRTDHARDNGTTTEGDMT